MHKLSEHKLHYVEWQNVGMPKANYKEALSYLKDFVAKLKIMSALAAELAQDSAAPIS